MNSVLAGLRSELLGLGINVKVELVNGVGVRLGNKNNFGVFVRKSDESLKEKKIPNHDFNTTIHFISFIMTEHEDTQYTILNVHDI